MAQKLLELRNLNKSFGGLTVISDLDLHVNEDEIVSVIGPNGAGKTTLFNLITGVYSPDDGEILLDGESIVGLEPHQVTNRGVARTFQTLRLFLNMSVRENVMAVAVRPDEGDGAWRSMLRLPRARREEREIRARAEEKSSFFGQRLVGYRWDQPAYSLSYCESVGASRSRGRWRPSRASCCSTSRGRNEPVGDARDRRADRQAARGRRLHDPRDRARHARRRGHLRSCRSHSTTASRSPKARSTPWRRIPRRRGLPRAAQGGAE